jgi:hypothetical protein
MATTAHLANTRVNVSAQWLWSLRAFVDHYRFRVVFDRPGKGASA